jgi:hypothetical protein
MDFEYDLKEKTPSIFDEPAKEPLITEKTEIESGVKRRWSVLHRWPPIHND